MDRADPRRGGVRLRLLLPARALAVPPQRRARRHQRRADRGPCRPRRCRASDLVAPGTEPADDVAWRQVIARRHVPPRGRGPRPPAQHRGQPGVRGHDPADARRPARPSSSTAATSAPRSRAAAAGSRPPRPARSSLTGYQRLDEPPSDRPAVVADGHRQVYTADAASDLGRRRGADEPRLRPAQADQAGRAHRRPAPPARPEPVVLLRLAVADLRADGDRRRGSTSCASSTAAPTASSAHARRDADDQDPRDAADGTPWDGADADAHGGERPRRPLRAPLTARDGGFPDAQRQRGPQADTSTTASTAVATLTRRDRRTARGRSATAGARPSPSTGRSWTPYG